MVFNIKNNGLSISNIGIGIGSNNFCAQSEIGSNNFFALFNMKGVDERYDEIWLTLYPGIDTDSHDTNMNISLNFNSIFHVMQNNSQLL